MTYISWAIFAEGVTDVEYFSALIPKVLSTVVLECNGPVATIPDAPVDVFGRQSRAFALAALEICRAKDAFFLLFVHGDTGGAAQERTLAQRTCALCEAVDAECGFQKDRCILITPRRETETWCISDKDALRAALGVGQNFDLSAVPDRAADLERLEDPKKVANDLVSGIGGRGKAAHRFPFSVIAQEQRIDRLDRLPSFTAFKAQVRNALETLGYLPN